jgi:hypothetical protein
MSDSVAYFAMGAVFGLVLCGWPWHPRFSRYQPRRRRSVPPQGDWMDEAFPLPPPDVMEAINRQLDRDIAAEVARRARLRGGNGEPRPIGPAPVLPVLPAPAQPRPRRRQTCR